MSPQLQLVEAGLQYIDQLVDVPVVPGSTGAVCEETVEISLLQLVEGPVVLVRGWFLGPCTQVQGRGPLS